MKFYKIVGWPNYNVVWMPLKLMVTSNKKVGFLLQNEIYLNGVKEELDERVSSVFGVVMLLFFLLHLLFLQMFNRELLDLSFEFAEEISF
jgi:hypothetical protein